MLAGIYFDALMIYKVCRMVLTVCGVCGVIVRMLCWHNDVCPSCLTSDVQCCACVQPTDIPFDFGHCTTLESQFPIVSPLCITTALNFPIIMPWLLSASTLFQCGLVLTLGEVNKGLSVDHCMCL